MATKKKRDHEKALARYKDKKNQGTGARAESTLDYFNRKLYPIIKDIDSNIDHAIGNSEGVLEDSTRNLVRYWWESFYQQTEILLDMSGKDRMYYQICQTLRLLIEFSADLNFINRNRENIAKFAEKMEEICEKQKNSDYTYRNAIDDGRFRLKFYDKKGNSEKSTTECRVKEACAESEDVKKIYGYLCMYSHANPIAMVWNVNKVYDDSSKKSQNIINENMYMIRFWPSIFKRILCDISEILDDESICKYPIEKVEEIFDATEKFKAE